MPCIISAKGEISMGFFHSKYSKYWLLEKTRSISNFEQTQQPVLDEKEKQKVLNCLKIFYFSIFKLSKNFFQNSEINFSFVFSVTKKEDLLDQERNVTKVNRNV